MNSAGEKQAAQSDICFSCAFSEQTVCEADDKARKRGFASPSLGSPLTEIVMTNTAVNTTVKNDKETDHVTFTGVYHNGYVPEGAYFISGNKFYLAADGSNTMKGYRAYFMPKDQVANVKGMSFTWEEDVTDVETTISSAEIIGIYNVNGVRLHQMQRGVNLLQMSDGTTRKVIVR